MPHSLAGRNVAIRGMLTNLGNPKVAVFFAAFLPQFVRAADGPASIQLLTFGGLFLLTGLLVDSLIAVGPAASGGLWIRSAGWRRRSA